MNIMAVAMGVDPSHEISGRVLALLVVALLVPCLAALFRLFFWPRLKGKLGEGLINFWIRQLLDPTVYHLIPDVTLPTADGTTQVDHVIVSRYGIFVIETKTYKGWIYGNATDSQWTQVNFRRKDRFQNPLRQNFRHTQTMAELMSLPPDFFKSMVIFVGTPQFKTEMPANVMLVKGFIRYIRSHTAPLIKDEYVPEIVAAIRAWASTVTCEVKAQHVSNLRRSRSLVREREWSGPVTAATRPRHVSSVHRCTVPANASGHTPACPRCGSTMLMRRSRAGREFWGCPGFPDCRGTRDAA